MKRDAHRFVLCSSADFQYGVVYSLSSGGDLSDCGFSTGIAAIRMLILNIGNG